MSVYFIQPEGEPVVKIGFASHVFGRVAAHQVSNHRKLILVGLLDGDPTVEAMFHRRFSGLHIRGEWFRLEGDLKAFLGKLPSPPTVPESPIFHPTPYDPSSPLVVAWFNKDDYETDEEMAWHWNMDADILRAELGESGRPHE